MGWRLDAPGTSSMRSSPTIASPDVPARPARSSWSAPAYCDPAATRTAASGSRSSISWVELVRLEGVVGRGGELVGERLDALLGLPTGGGEPAVGSDEAGGRIPSTTAELGARQVGDPPELLGGHALGQRVQHVGLRAADARGHEGGDVSVAACREAGSRRASRATGSVGTGSVRTAA